jgi:Tfp pilus tip-associated adhesin PilY1
MLHAFNGGYFNPATLQYEKGYASTNQYKLGAELWSYIPYNALPHLKYLSDPSYGSKDGDHISLVDGESRIFDARIFNDSTFSGGIDGQSSVSHPNGWGTVLIGGMRFGGGPVEVDTDNDGTVDQTLRSSIFVLDITDPEKPPKLLMEYSSAELGFTVSNVSPIVKNNGSGKDEWYLLLGSGPRHTTTPQTALQTATSDQPAKLFLFNMKTMQLESSFGTSGVLTMNGANDATDAFITGLYPVDYNLDSQTDAVYVSTVNGTAGNFAGKLYRLTLRNSDGSSSMDSGSYKNISSWSADIMLDNTGPITALSNAGLDESGNRWIYFGTGRFLVRSDAVDNSQQSFYGIKEPRHSNGGYLWSTVDSTKVVDVSDITVRTDGNLYKNGSTTSVSTHTTSGHTASSFPALKLAMQTTGSNANHGWKRDFGESPNTTYERNVGQAVLIGGVLAYTAFEPSGDVCKYEGSSTLYAVNYLTGTASSSTYVFENPDASSGPAEIIDSVFIGSGLTATINLHIGTGQTRQNILANNQVNSIGQSSNALIFQKTLNTEGAVTSGETNWRIAK